MKNINSISASTDSIPSLVDDIGYSPPLCDKYFPPHIADSSYGINRGLGNTGELKKHNGMFANK